MENLENKLWQSMDKNDLDLENKISEKDWREFLDFYGATYANEASEIARILFNEYLINYKKG
jgi:hypothetical protein